MKQKCDRCGVIDICNTVLEYKNSIFGFKLKFCYHCRDKIVEFIREKGA